MSRDQRERFINQVEWELEDDMQLFFQNCFSRMQLDSNFFISQKNCRSGFSRDGLNSF